MRVSSNNYFPRPRPSRPCPTPASNDFKIVAAVEPAAFVYLFWIDETGAGIPVYPWTEFKWDTRPTEEKPVSKVEVKSPDGAWLKIVGDTAGMETYLMIARSTRLESKEAAGWFSGLKPLPFLGVNSRIWFENFDLLQGDVVRGFQYEGVLTGGTGALQQQVLLGQRIGSASEFSRATTFARLGKSEGKSGLDLADGPPMKLTGEQRRMLEAKWQAANAAGIKAYQNWQSDDALTAFEEALTAAQQLYNRGEYPDGHTNFATSLTNLALVYRDQGKLADAEPLYKSALDMSRRLYKGNHPEVLRISNNLVGVYRDQGKVQIAISHATAALEMAKTLFGGNHPSVADSLNNLGTLHRAVGRLAEAEPLFKEALTSRTPAR